MIVTDCFGANKLVKQSGLIIKFGRERRYRKSNNLPCCRELKLLKETTFFNEYTRLTTFVNEFTFALLSCCLFIRWEQRLCF